MLIKWRIYKIINEATKLWKQKNIWQNIIKQHMIKWNKDFYLQRKTKQKKNSHDLLKLCENPCKLQTFFVCHFEETLLCDIERKKNDQFHNLNDRK